MANKDIGKLAREYYLTGYGCAESILLALNEKGILDVPETLLKASTGFDTGFGGKGSTCGGITGPIMAIGLKYGRLKSEESTKKVYRCCKEIVDAYEKKYETTECAQVTRVWRESGKFNTPERRKFCSAIAMYMARETEKILT